MAKKPLYKGFSSFEFQRTKNFRLTDMDLVKMDLLNHIFTRRGERVMMTEFGTIIPDLVFEPLDEELLATLEDELLEVFEYDPRVDIIEFSVEPNFDNNAVNVHARLFYIELNLVDDMDLNIEFDQGT